MQKRILVIDDDELILGALDSFLKYEKFETETVSSAAFIDQTIADFKPDLIIMDIRLDDADGRVICDGLKDKSGSSNIPIILLTGLSYEEIALIECKADAIIGKPYESISLLNTIDQLLMGLASYDSQALSFNYRPRVIWLNPKDADGKFLRYFWMILVKPKGLTRWLKLFYFWVILYINLHSWMKYIPGEMTFHKTLTQKALGVLNLVSQGMSNAEIGSKLFTSKRTVEG